jgi:oxygen-independent coproporphyrinogen-3 oxidase
MSSRPAGIIEFDRGLLQKYDRAGPRYTSYPPANRLTEAFTSSDYQATIARRNAGSRIAPLSLYFHLPFCRSPCFFCGCNRIITRDQGRADHYVRYLIKEIGLQAALLAPHLEVGQLHWGGGTPTFLTDGQMTDLIGAIRASFDLAPDAECSIEVDPRAADEHKIKLLGTLGFNRISVGVQDFDPAVQHAVNRIQSEMETRRVVEVARTYGFQSTNIDLIYGLPHQTAITFAHTLERVIDMAPERVALYNYAHLPRLFKAQRHIHEADLPTPEQKLEILRTSIRHLEGAEYVHIGMDHFAKPSDDLHLAQREGRLHRNFQGYSTHADCDLVAMGITGISSFRDAYAQNVRALDSYYAALDRGRLPVFRGIRLTPDDQLRRTVIQTLICNFALSMGEISRNFKIDFCSYFSSELQMLRKMAPDGLLHVNDDSIIVTRKGRLLIRNICMAFDSYLRADADWAAYSRCV